MDLIARAKTPRIIAIIGIAAPDRNTLN